MRATKRRLERLTQAIAARNAPNMWVLRVYVYRDGAIYNKHTGELTHALDDLLESYGQSLEGAEIVTWGKSVRILRGFSIDDL